MTYKVINTLTGRVTNCTIPNLPRKLYHRATLAEYVRGQCVASYPITHAMLVHCAVEFAEYALKHYTKAGTLPDAERCNALTRKWLADPNSVSKEELNVAAAANPYAAAAADSGKAAASAAYAAANADYATYAAAHSADAAAYAATAAAVHAAAAGADAPQVRCVRAAVERRQGEFILEYLRSGSI